MAQYTIKDLENVSGVKAHTIRIWEKRYDIISPDRTDTNIRTYNDDDLRRLLNISILNNHGIKISHLAKMTTSEIQDKVLFVSRNTGDFHAQVEALILSMLNLDEVHFHMIFNKSVLANGFETTFEEIVLKALDRIGILWLTGTINPAQEHFITNLIRQKLITNIDSIVVTNEESNKRFALFLPEGEMHELGLLYASYLIKRRGHEVLYFGQQTPYTSVHEAIQKWRTDYLVISLVSPPSTQTPESLLVDLEKHFQGKQILLTGSFAQKLDVSAYQNFEVFTAVKDFVKYLDKI
jgi:DNA-binding transcriptional MerR regulator